MTMPTVVKLGKAAYTLGVIDPTKNLTPETGGADTYCGADLPADLTNIGVTPAFQASGYPYPTNSWLSQVLRPPASVPQGAFYPLPFGVAPAALGASGLFALNVSLSQTLLFGNLSPAGPDGTVSPFAFGWVADPAGAPDWATSRKIFAWLQGNPAKNPYLAVTGALLRTDLSSLAADLKGSGYDKDADAIAGVLQNYAAPKSTVINYLSKPAVDHHFTPQGNEWMITPAATSGVAGFGVTSTQSQTQGRILIDRYDPLSADLVVSTGSGTGTGTGTGTGSGTGSGTAGSTVLKVVRGSPFLTFLLPAFDLDLQVLAYGQGGGAAVNPVLTLASGDQGDANGLPTKHYFGMSLNGNFWAVIQTPGSPFSFVPLASQPAITSALPGTFVLRTQTQGCATAAQRACVLALLPWDDDPTTRAAILDEFAGYAFNVVTGGSVSFDVSDTDCSVTTTFSLTTQNLLGKSGPAPTMLGLLPHHYNENALVAVDGSPAPTARYCSQAGPRGVVCFYKGSSFQTRHPFPGVLPLLPSGFGSDASQLGRLATYLDNFQSLAGSASQHQPWYPGTWDMTADTTQPYAPFLPKDTYGAGKQMGALVQYAHAAEAAAAASTAAASVETAAGKTAAAQAASAAAQTATAQAAAAQGAVASMLKLWLGDPGVAKMPSDLDPPKGVTAPTAPQPFYYFAWEPNYRSMLGYPGSYGSTTALNDHHFHYGYFLSAAAWLATKDATFAGDYGQMIDLLAADVGCTPDIQAYITKALGKSGPTFPIQRYFDVYEGHPWATGYQAPSVTGPQNEATTEALNSWIGMVLWGRIAGRPAIEKAGIYLLATHAAGIAEYSFNVGANLTTDLTACTVAANADASGNVGNCRASFVNFDGMVQDNVLDKHVRLTNPGWLYCTRVFGAGVSSGTDWQEFPTYRYTILWLPVTAGALYLGRYTAHNQAAFIQMQNAAATEVAAVTIPDYPPGRTTPGRYWPTLLNHPYTWATVTLPFAALTAGTGTFTFPTGGGWTGGALRPVDVFHQWVELANTQSTTRYPGQAPTDYQAAGVYFQEDGTTLASAYHFVVGLSRLGRPVFGGSAVDTATTSALPLFAIFQDDVNQQLNLVAYNAGTNDTTVQFADGDGKPLGAPVKAAAGSLGQATVAIDASWSFLSPTHTAMTLPAAKSGPVPVQPPAPPPAFKWSVTGFVGPDGKSKLASFPVAGASYPASPGSYPFLAGTNLSAKTTPVVSVVGGGTFGTYQPGCSATHTALVAVPPAPGGKAGTYDLQVINFDAKGTAHTTTFPKAITYASPAS